MPLWNTDEMILARLQTCLGNLSAADIPAGRKASILQRRLLPDHFFLLQHGFLLHDSTLGLLDHLVTSAYLGWKKWAPLSILPSRLLAWLQTMVLYRLLARPTTSTLAAAAAPLSPRLGALYAIAVFLSLFSKHRAKRVAKQLLLFSTGHDDPEEPEQDYHHMDFLSE